MNQNWLMLCTGILLSFGIAMTPICGPMPGAKPLHLHPPPLRFRLILISSGLLMSLLGAARLIDKLRRSRVMWES